MTYSIWRDIFVDFGAVASANYKVEVTGYGEVFVGKAYARPGATTLRVRINDIIADAYGLLLQLPESQFDALTWPMEVKVTNTDTSTQVWKNAVAMDWSYDYGEDIDANGISDPITGEISVNQILFRSVIVSPLPVSYLVTYTKADGTTGTNTESTDAVAVGFNDGDFRRRLMAAGSGTIAIYMSDYDPDVVAFEVDGYTYKVTSCGDIVLYYLNAYGGWDSLLLHTRLHQEDALTRHTIGVDYDNGTADARGRVNYATEIQRRYTMNTGWLTDEQAARMHHLLNSPCVYLQDLASAGADIVPVVLTNTSTEYKTYLGQGARMVDYTITADLAADMMRQ